MRAGENIKKSVLYIIKNVYYNSSVTQQRCSKQSFSTTITNFYKPSNHDLNNECRGMTIHCSCF